MNKATYTIENEMENFFKQLEMNKSNQCVSSILEFLQIEVLPMFGLFESCWSN